MKETMIQMLEALIYVHNLCNLDYATTEKVTAAIEQGQKALTMTTVADQQLS